MVAVSSLKLHDGPFDINVALKRRCPRAINVAVLVGPEVLPLAAEVVRRKGGSQVPCATDLCSSICRFAGTADLIVPLRFTLHCLIMHTGRLDG